MRNDWCYVHYLNNTKPKGIFKKIGKCGGMWQWLSNAYRKGRKYKGW